MFWADFGQFLGIFLGIFGADFWAFLEHFWKNIGDVLGGFWGIFGGFVVDLLWIFGAFLEKYSMFWADFLGNY